MALAPADIGDIEALLGTPGSVARPVAVLRQRFPGLTITQCDPSDIDLAVPFRHWTNVSLHLIDGSNHCWQLTDDAERATGLVVVVHPTGP